MLANVYSLSCLLRNLASLQRCRHREKLRKRTCKNANKERLRRYTPNTLLSMSSNKMEVLVMLSHVATVRRVSNIHLLSFPCTSNMTHSLYSFPYTGGRMLGGLAVFAASCVGVNRNENFKIARSLSLML